MFNSDRLRQLRKSKGLTQRDLAQLLGVSRNTIVNWETGRRSPRAYDIARFNSIFNVSEQELLYEQSQDNTSVSYAFWGKVADEAIRLAERGDKHEISLILPILKLACDLCSQRIKA